jgi:molybdate transport system substrate-binding protein
VHRIANKSGFGARIVRGDHMKISMAVLGGIAMAVFGQVAGAAEITVLSAGAIEPGLRAAVAAYEKETRHEVKITFNTAPQIQKRLGSGETWDVVIAPPAVIEALAKTGKVEREWVMVGRVGMGVAVRPGAPVPDISSAEALKKSVLEAESLVFNRASTGLYFENLLKKMGLYDQVEGKTTRYPDGASVMEHVLKGKGKEVGFGPITEILLYRKKGLKLVGPLPAEVQNYTSYTAAPMTGATDPKLARELIRYLGSPAGKALFVAAGVE